MKNINLVAKIASGRISTLLAAAESRTVEKSDESNKLAKRYTHLAQRIRSHYNVGIPKELKHRICKKCGNFLVPGVNCKVRVASVHGYVAYVCECGAERHLFYKKKHRV
jgi:ribonuclease P protein subunit RPR2